MTVRNSGSSQMLNHRTWLQLVMACGSTFSYVKSDLTVWVGACTKSYLVQFSCSVVSDSLRPHESQHARPPCPSPTSRVHSDSCALSWWCHPAISSSVIPFSSCPNPSQQQSLFKESTLHMRWPKYWSFSFSISPSKEHPGLISFRIDLGCILTVNFCYT